MKKINFRGGETRNTQLNISVALLKMLMCFEVVCCHFWLYEKTDVPIFLTPFYVLKDCAVPVFMLLSFFYFYKHLDEMNLNKLMMRIKRLYIPQFVWGVVYWLLFSLLDILLKVDHVKGLKSLGWQIFTGHSEALNPSMWYQFDLIILTVLVSILAIVGKKNITIYSLFILTIVSLVLQYSGINQMLFGNLIYELKYPIGRLAEMIPYVFLGLTLKNSEIFYRIQKYRWYVMIFAVSLMVINSYLFWINKVGQVRGFSYAGGFLIIMSLCLVTIVFLIPQEVFKSKKIYIISETISRYTLGIYCMHRLVGRVLKYIMSFLGIQLDTFLLCIIIYLVSYCISYSMSMIAPKLSKKLVI